MTALLTSWNISSLLTGTILLSVNASGFDSICTLERFPLSVRKSFHLLLSGQKMSAVVLIFADLLQEAFCELIEHLNHVPRLVGILSNRSENIEWIVVIVFPVSDRHRISNNLGF